MNIKVDEEMVAKVEKECEYFNQLIESGVQHYERTNDPIAQEKILKMIRVDRSCKNDFLRALDLIGFPGVSNVNGLYEFSADNAYATIND